MPRTVFVIYGQDRRAYDELSKCLASLGVSQITFDEVSAKLPQPAFVADVVFTGIASADAVIVLLTPDELAVHYDAESARFLGQDMPNHARWQARPNVIFEAGVALGAQKGNTILATVGADVSLFSDVGGMHTVRLDAPDGKKRLRERLRSLLPDIAEPGHAWDGSSDSGDFVGCARRRWTAFDDVAHLADKLAADTVFDDASDSVLDVVGTIAKRNRGAAWRAQTPWDFCLAMERYYHRSVVDFCYWSLFVHGFFSAKNDEQFFHGDGHTWRQGAPYAIFAERGLRLIERLRQVPSNRGLQSAHRATPTGRG